MSAEPKKPKADKSAPASTLSPDIDENLHAFWTKYGSAILTFCTVALVGYLVVAGYKAWQTKREASLGQEFAALTTPAQWRAFAAAHAGDRLAGLAYVDVADDAYASGQIASAQEAYEDAIPLLKDDPLQVRARIGEGVCLVQLGQVEAGQTKLRGIFDDKTLLPVARAEAGYQLASIAMSSGHPDDARAMAMQLLSIDAHSPWTQMALMLRPPTR